MGKPQLREVNKISPRESIVKTGIERKSHISPFSEHYTKCHLLLQNKKQDNKLQIDDNISLVYRLICVCPVLW